MADNTKDVEVLLGNPKKAMLAMAIPVIISMIVQNTNNLIDTAWVAGLGTHALAAVGFAFPLFFIIIGIANGIGVGSSSAISRSIGMGDRESANRTAGQAIILTVIISVVIGVLLLLVMEPMFQILGAGIYTQDCVDYFTPVALTMPVALVGVVMAHILRSEGASRMAMYSQVLAAVLNIILDPFFIYDYGLGLGLAGAAWATGISMSVSTVLLLYLYLFTNRTYLRIDFNGFRLDWKQDKAILRVGLPASLEMVVVSLVSMVANLLLVYVDPENGVAIYSSTWKIIQLIMVPIFGMGSSVVPVCAAAYGLRRFDNIRTSYRFSILLITAIMVVILVIVFITADYIVMMFTYTDSTAALRPDMAYGLRLSCLFIILVPWGLITGSLYQSLGFGLRALVCTFFRNIILLPIAGGMGIYFGSMQAFWVGIVIADMVGTLVVGIGGLFFLRSLPGRTHTDSPSQKC